MEAGRLVASDFKRLSSSYLCSKLEGKKQDGMGGGGGGAQPERALLVCVWVSFFAAAFHFFFAFFFYLYKTKPFSDRRNQVEHALTSFQAKP